MHRHTTTLLLTLALIATATHAATNNPRIDLEYLPQQEVAAAEFTLRGELYDAPVRLTVVDERPLEDLSELGVRTDDDDRRHTLSATSKVEEFAAEVLRQVTIERGLTIDPEASTTLTVEIRRFRIEETNQAVGATYNAVVNLTGKLTADDGGSLWSGVAVGDATRYGRKFSNTNCNEVLSDALLEAWAGLLSNGDLQEAWIGQ